MDETACLSVPLARLRPADKVAVHIELVDLAVAVAAEQILIRRRRRADAPRRTDVGDRLDEIQIGVVHLDAPVTTIRDVDVVFCVSRDAMHRIELIHPGASRADGFYPRTVLRDLGDARIGVTVAHEDVVLAVERDVSGSAEGAGISGRIADFVALTTLEVTFEEIDRLRLAAKD